MERKALPNNTVLSTTRFLYGQLVTRFGIPLHITSEKEVFFVNRVIRTITNEFKTFYTFFSPYYPRANGQGEATNKLLVTILYTTYGVEKEDWEERLLGVLWAYQTTYKAITGQTPFHLLYGKRQLCL